MARARKVRKLISKYVQRMHSVRITTEQASTATSEDARYDVLQLAAWELAGAQALAIRIERMGGRI